MKKLISFAISMAIVASVCIVPSFAHNFESPDSEPVNQEYTLSKEECAYYYEDALNRSICANQAVAPFDMSTSENITYIDGGIEVCDEKAIRQTIVEIKSNTVGVIAARAKDYWYSFQLGGGGPLMATVWADCQFEVTHGVSVKQNGHEDFNYEIEPEFDGGILLVDEGATSWVTSADKHTCTYKQNYRMDYDWYLKTATLTISCDYNAKVSSPSHDYTI